MRVEPSFAKASAGEGGQSFLPITTHSRSHILPHIQIIQIDITGVVVGGAIEEAPGEAGFFRV